MCIRDRAGDGYEVYIAQTRAVAIVGAATNAAENDNLKNNTMLKACLLYTSGKSGVRAVGTRQPAAACGQDAHDGHSVLSGHWIDHYRCGNHQRLSLIHI